MCIGLALALMLDDPPYGVDGIVISCPLSASKLKYSKTDAPDSFTCILTVATTVSYYNPSVTRLADQFPNLSSLILPLMILDCYVQFTLRSIY